MAYRICTLALRVQRQSKDIGFTGLISANARNDQNSNQFNALNKQDIDGPRLIESNESDSSDPVVDDQLTMISDDKVKYFRHKLLTLADCLKRKDTMSFQSGDSYWKYLKSVQISTDNNGNVNGNGNELCVSFAIKRQEDQDVAQLCQTMTMQLIKHLKMKQIYVKMRISEMQSHHIIAKILIDTDNIELPPQVYYSDGNIEQKKDILKLKGNGNGVLLCYKDEDRCMDKDFLKRFLETAGLENDKNVDNIYDSTARYFQDTIMRLSNCLKRKDVSKFKVFPYWRCVSKVTVINPNDIDSIALRVKFDLNYDDHMNNCGSKEKLSHLILSQFIKHMRIGDSVRKYVKIISVERGSIDVLMNIVHIFEVVGGVSFGISLVSVVQDYKMSELRRNALKQTVLRGGLLTMYYLMRKKNIGCEYIMQMISIGCLAIAVFWKAYLEEQAQIYISAANGVLRGFIYIPGECEYDMET